MASCCPFQRCVSQKASRQNATTINGNVTQVQCGRRSRLKPKKSTGPTKRIYSTSKPATQENRTRVTCEYWSKAARNCPEMSS